jgi:hypothetical protein
MTPEYGTKEFDASPIRSSMGPNNQALSPTNQDLGPTTSNSINRGMAAMPAQERSIRIDERPVAGDQPQRRHREAMARNTSPNGSNPRAGAEQWDDAAGWEQDEAARHRARRLLSRSNSRFHRVGDRVSSLQRRMSGERWVKRFGIVIAMLVVIFAGCFGGLW